MKSVALLEAALISGTAYSTFRLITAVGWQESIFWWIFSLIGLLNFWILGVPAIVRLAVVILSGLAVANQYSTLNVTSTHIIIGATILFFTLLLCQFQYLADVVWSIKTIVIDWLVCTFLVIITAVVDALYDNHHLVLVIAYFCSSNILSVVVMKTCEALLKWRSPEGPHARFIHNLSIPIPLLPSLHVGQLLIVAWMFVLILAAKFEYFYFYKNEVIPGWHLMAVSGFWGGLFCYMCPIIANKNPAPYVAPPSAASDQTLRQRRQN